MNLPDITLRTAEPRDARSMLALHAQAVHSFCAEAYSPEHMEWWFAGRDESIYHDAIRSRRVWLAEADQVLLGFVSTLPGEVTLLFVSPKASGKNIGARLLDFGLSQAAVDFEGPVQVIATMNSVSFYVRHGFAVVGEELFERGTPALRYPVVRMVHTAASVPCFAAPEA